MSDAKAPRAPDASEDGPYHAGLHPGQHFKRHHKNSAFTVAWSLDGKHLFSGGGDNTTRIWSVEGRLVHTMTPELGNHNSHTTGLAVRRAEDGEEELITGSYDETIRFWRNQGTKKHFEHKMTMVYCMAVSPDERCVAAGNNDGKIRMIDAADGTHRAMLLGPKTAVLSIDWSPDSKSVCCGSRDERAYVWKLGNLKIGPEEEMRLLQQEYHRFDGHKNDVSGIAWHPDGLWIATCAHDSTIRIWHQGSGRLVYKIDIPLPEDYASSDYDSDDENDLRATQHRDRQRHHNSAICLQWSKDGRNLVTGHIPGWLCVYSSGGNLLHKYEKAHEAKPIYMIRMCPVEGNEMIATSGEDHCIAVWKPINATGTKALTDVSAEGGATTATATPWYQGGATTTATATAGAGAGAAEAAEAAEELTLEANETVEAPAAAPTLAADPNDGKASAEVDDEFLDSVD